MPDGRSQEAGELAAGMMLGTHDQLMDAAARRLLQDAPKATRFVLKKIPGAPGFAYNLVQMATSDQPLRTAAGIGGGMVGASAGGALGAAAGGVNAPVGAVLGGAAGAHVATSAYDDYYAQHRAQLDEMNRWIVARRKELLGR